MRYSKKRKISKKEIVIGSCVLITFAIFLFFAFIIVHHYSHEIPWQLCFCSFAFLIELIPLYFIYKKLKKEEIEKLRLVQEEETKRKEMGDFRNGSIKMCPEEFLNVRKIKKGKRDFLISGRWYDGVYVILNKTKNMYYVGQSQDVPNRLHQHFTGKGNGDVYADWKYGDKFIIEIVMLNKSGCSSLNELERSLIKKYDAYSSGYNKNKGNYY